MISSYPLNCAMPLDGLEQQHKQNTALLMHCREQRAMLATQREALASQRIPIDSKAELPTSTPPKSTSTN